MTTTYAPECDLCMAQAPLTHEILNLCSDPAVMMEVCEPCWLGTETDENYRKILPGEDGAEVRRAVNLARGGDDDDL